MPRVPVAVDNSVQLRPTTGARFEPTQQNAVSDAIGKGLEQVGAQGQQYAAIKDRQDAMFDEARAKDADNQYVKHATDQGFGDGGYFTTENAATLNARSGYEKALRDKRDELVNAAQTPREAYMLKNVLDRRLNADLEGSARYATAQAKQYWTVQSNARVANATDDYARYVDDPQRSAEALATINSEVSAQAAHNGLQDAGIIRKMQYDAASKAYAGAVEAKAVNDPIAAALMLDKNRDKIGTATLLDLDRQLHPKLVDHDAALAADAAKTVATPGVVVNNTAGQPTLLQMPVGPGRQSSGFGNRADPMTGQRKFHAGLDLPRPAGTVVGAGADGVVEQVVHGNTGYGNHVVIKHPDGTTESLYGHLATTTVKVGDQVTRGQQIGTVGSTGKSTGPHLHFEVRKNGTAVDPTNLIGKAVGTAGDPPKGQPEADLGTQIAAAKAYNQQHLAGRPQAYIDEVNQAAEGRLVHDYSMAKQFDAERYEKAANEAYRVTDALGDKFTSVTQIPNYGSLSETTQHSFREIAAAHVKAAQGGDGVTTDPKRWYALQDQYHRDPTSVLSIRPEQAATFLGKGEMSQFMAMRGAVLDAQRTGDTPKTPKWQSGVDMLEASKDVVKSTLNANGVLTGTGRDSMAPANQAKVLQYHRKLQDWGDNYHATTGKWPDAKAIQTRIDELALMDARTGKHLYESPQAVPGVAVPPAFIDQWRKTKNPNASQEEVRSGYVQYLKRKQGQ